jgi:hypothetical protein
LQQFVAVLFTLCLRAMLKCLDRLEIARNVV